MSSWRLLLATCGLLSCALALARANPAPGAEHTQRPAWSGRHASTTPRFHLKLGPTGHPEIPGLYGPEERHITPIQGKAEFERRVLGLDAGAGSECPKASEASLRQAGANQTISLVQFYVATCPDCQGFSPYFKRLIRDIGPHWGRLVRVFVVNCVDHQNLPLCQEENPELRVPFVRWYVLPVLQAHIRRASSNETTTPATKCPATFKYAPSLLNVGHRSSFIEKQRRDHISLRHATLRLAALMLDELAHPGARAPNSSLAVRAASAHAHSASSSSSSSGPDRQLLEAMPPQWFHLEQLGAAERDQDPSPAGQFLRGLVARAGACSAHASKRASGTAGSTPLRHFVLFEPRTSFVGRTLVADWSAYVCDAAALKMVGRAEKSAPLMIVHRTSDTSLLPIFNVTKEAQDKDGKEGGHYLVSFELRDLPAGALNGTHGKPAGEVEKLLREHLAHAKLLSSASNDKDHEQEHREHHGRALSHAQHHAHHAHLHSHRAHDDHHQHHHQQQHGGRTRRMAQARVQQRASLERYYASQRGRYAHHALQRRDTTHDHGTRAAADDSSDKDKKQAELEHANWVPEFVFPHEERLRYKFNKRIAHEMDLKLELNETAAAHDEGEVAHVLPGALLAGQHPGEIHIQHSTNDTRLQVLECKKDDLSLMFLTDYYKALDDIVHADMAAKRELDVYQLLATTCFMRDLTRHFPFQGDAHGSQQLGSKSTARHYVQLLQQAWLADFGRHLLSNGSAADAGGKLAGSDACPKLDKLASELLASKDKGKSSQEALAKIERVRVPMVRLQATSNEIKKKHQVSLPRSEKIKWEYCAGSSGLLRGHTCSLWVLFHTITTNEYLEQMGNKTASEDTKELVKYQIDFKSKPAHPCNPEDPEEDYVKSKTRELHVNATEFALANIINFVRFYLPCTNCAAHFSCMVNHSPGLSFGHARQPDAHLLWLWEGHNRVNERTRGTHSEDPVHPKHVFPCYDACPQCYLEKPPELKTTTLDKLKFNRHELVKFLVARYQKTAMLNNKVNIERLYKE